MLTIGLTAVFGVIALAVLCAFFNTRRAERLADVRRQVEQEVGLIVRRAEDTDRQMAAALERGEPVDQALANYQDRRASLVQTLAAKSWSWDGDDLKTWEAEQLGRRSDEVNRKLLLPAVGGTLFVIALTLMASAVLYNFSLSRPAGADAVSPWQGAYPAGNPPALLPPAPLPAGTDPNAGPNSPTPGQPTVPAPAPDAPVSPPQPSPAAPPPPAPTPTPTPEPAPKPTNPPPSDGGDSHRETF